MKIEKLKTFCGKSPDKNHLSEPFTIGEFTFATNGWILVRVDKVETIIEGEKPPVGLGPIAFDHDEIGGWVELPDYELESPGECHSCGGTGKSCECEECEGGGVVVFENDFNEYECDCETCGGNGEISGGKDDCEKCGGSGKTTRDIQILTWDRGSINACLLDMISDLDGVKISTHGDDLDMIRFKFNGGCGLIMPCRK